MDSYSTSGGKPARSDAGSESGYSAISTLEHLEGKVTGLFRMLKAEVESLKDMAKRTQVKGLKESVDQVCSIIGSIENNNVELKVARSQQAGNKLVVVDAKKVVAILTQTLNTTVESSNKAVLDAIASVSEKVTGYEDGDFVRPGGANSAEVKAAVVNLQTMIEAQSAKMEEMAEQGKQTSWTDVVRKTTKRGKGGKPAELAAAGTGQINEKHPATGQQSVDSIKLSGGEQANKVDKPRRTRRRPPAIMVDATSYDDFPALARRIKSGMDDQCDAITGMKKTRNGGLLLEVRGDDTVLESIRMKVADSAGQEVKVRLLQQRTLLEIRDIDAWSNKEEITDSLEKEAAISKENVKVISLRASYGGSQTALVLLPASQAHEVVKKGRLKISVVSCRVREAEKRNGRCFKCLAFDHESKSCKGPDRSKCCRRCGQSGHYVADCIAERADAAAFTEALKKEALRHQEVITATGSKGKETTSQAAEIRSV